MSYVLVCSFLLQSLMRRQDDQLEEVGQSVGVLKSIGIRIDNELDEQSV